MSFQVRNLERHDREDGRLPFFTATIVSGEVRVEVHSRFGAWYAEIDGDLKPLKRVVETKLAEKVRPILNAERRAREKARRPRAAEATA